MPGCGAGCPGQPPPSLLRAGDRGIGAGSRSDAAAFGSRRTTASPEMGDGFGTPAEEHGELHQRSCPWGAELSQV